MIKTTAESAPSGAGYTCVIGPPTRVRNESSLMFKDRIIPPVAGGLMTFGPYRVATQAGVVTNPLAVVTVNR